MKKLSLLITLLFLSFSTLNAQNMPAMNQNALRHANPMPNLMRIAMGNAELLHITPKQMHALQAWTKEHKPQMRKMIQTVMREERRLENYALLSDKHTVDEAALMLETRKQIIILKTKCRANLRKILTPQQYAAVINIYKSVR